MREPSILERNVDLTMVRSDLDHIPRYVVPDGYALRTYAPGDERAWVEIQSVADVYNVITPDLFRREYGDDPHELGRRLFMLVGPTGGPVGAGGQVGDRRRVDDGAPVGAGGPIGDGAPVGGGTPIGTAAAWFGGRGDDRTWGRVHWVAIHPAYQGRGLAKPLLSRVCAALRELGHERAYLTTASARVPAIALYLHFGFEPAIDGPEDAAAWAELLRAVPDLARRTPQGGAAQGLRRA